MFTRGYLHVSAGSLLVICWVSDTFDNSHAWNHPLSGFTVVPIGHDHCWGLPANPFFIWKALVIYQEAHETSGHLKFQDKLLWTSLSGFCFFPVKTKKSSIWVETKYHKNPPMLEDFPMKTHINKLPDARHEDGKPPSGANWSASTVLGGDGR